MRWPHDGPPAHFGPGYRLLDRMARLVDPWVMVRLQLAWLFDRIWNQTPRFDGLARQERVRAAAITRAVRTAPVERLEQEQ